MLAFSVEQGGFFMIGDTLVRISEVRGDYVRVAIAAPADVPVHRLDPQGRPLNLFRKIIGTNPGQNTVILSCGHQVPTPAKPIPLECPHCAAHAAKGTALIQQHFTELHAPRHPRHAPAAEVTA